MIIIWFFLCIRCLCSTITTVCILRFLKVISCLYKISLGIYQLFIFIFLLITQIRFYYFLLSLITTFNQPLCNRLKFSFISILIFNIALHQSRRLTLGWSFLSNCYRIIWKSWSWFGWIRSCFFESINILKIVVIIFLVSLPIPIISTTIIIIPTILFCFFERFITIALQFIDMRSRSILRTIV